MITPLTLLSAYLLGTLPLLLVNGGGARTLLLEAAHVAVAVAFVSRARDDRSEPDIWTWLPLLFVPWLYAEIPLLNQWRAGGYFDATVQQWETVLFPSRPARTWASAMPSPWLSETLHAAYLSYYPLIFVPSVVLFLRGRVEGLRRGILAVVITFLACYVSFVVFPVQGPRYLFPSPPEMPDGPFRRLASGILEAGSSRGAAFPSLHVALAVTQALVIRRYFGSRWGWTTAALAFALAAGAVYGGFHYAVDAVFGAGVGGLAFIVSGLVSPAKA